MPGSIFRRLWATLWVWIGLLSVLPGFSGGLAPQVVAASAIEAQEYSVKAAFLFNFARFVEWPEESFSAARHFLLCILGRDPFGSALSSIDGKTVEDRQLVVKHIDSHEAAAACHILFISTSEEARVPYILRDLQGYHILTISEFAQFAQRGGIINFIIVDNKIRFEINPGAARDAGLKISSKLLKLADIIQ